MTPEYTAQDKLDLIGLIKIADKWRKPLLIVFITSIIISFIFTLPFIMKPLYKATAVIYPVNITPYSEESPTEQMLQLLNSEDVRDNLIDAFDLYSHYNIDTASNMPRFKMMQMLDQNISVQKTEYESVEISIYDTDPAVAALMCDSLIKYMDRKAINLVRERTKEIIVILKGQFDSKTAEIDSMEARLYELRSNYGIFDYTRQVEGFSREYYKAKVQGDSRILDTDKKNLEEKGGEYLALYQNLESERKTYNKIKVKYDQALTDLIKVASFHNDITRAVPPEKKDSPKRLVIMLIFTLSVMMLAFVIIIYKEYYEPRIREQLNRA